MKHMYRFHGSTIFRFPDNRESMIISTNFYSYGSVKILESFRVIVFLDRENICFDTEFMALPFLVFQILAKARFLVMCALICILL